MQCVVPKQQKRQQHSKADDKEDDTCVQDHMPGWSALSGLGLHQVSSLADAQAAPHGRQGLSLEQDAADHGEQNGGKDYDGDDIKHFPIAFLDIHTQIFLGCDNMEYLSAA